MTINCSPRPAPRTSTPDQDPKAEAEKAIPGNDKDFVAAGGLGTDTNGEYTMEDIKAAGNTDQPTFNASSGQWIWAEKQLADTRAKGQYIIDQFHHAAYSSGVHGPGMASATADGQPGSPMRVYTPLLGKYGVATVIPGHDEMFERSWVDEDGGSSENSSSDKSSSASFDKDGKGYSTGGTIAVVAGVFALIAGVLGAATQHPAGKAVIERLARQFGIQLPF